MLSLNAISATAISESTGTFTGNLFAMVDELVADDGDYISVLLPGQTAKLALTPLTDPSSSTGHVFSFRAYSAQLRSLQADVYFGGVLIKSTTVVLTASAALNTVTLSAAEADSIGNYAAGEIWLTGLAS